MMGWSYKAIDQVKKIQQGIRIFSFPFLVNSEDRYVSVPHGLGPHERSPTVTVSRMRICASFKQEYLLFPHDPRKRP